MSSIESGIHWFIARDGRQHGPVSDMEMRKLVELGHLRHSDLLWRQGFPDWRPAPAVFSAPPPTAAPAPQLQERSRPQPVSPNLMPRFEATAGRGATSGAAATAAAAAAANGSAMTRTMTQGLPYQGGMHNGAPNAGPQLSSLQSAPQDRHGGAAGSRTSPQFIPTAGASPRDVKLEANPAAAYREPATGRSGPSGASTRPKGRRALVATLALFGIAGSGWYAATKHGSAIKSFIAAKTSSTAKASPEAAPATPATAAAAVTATAADPAKPAETVPVALSPPPPEKVQSIEAALQKAEYWKVIAAEFPDWYREKVDAAARLAAEGKSDPEVSRTLVQAVVELRRSQSEAALGASNETLKSLASAFKSTVTRMAKEGTPTCMAFIMSGESNDAVVAVIADPAKNAEINAHLLAVFNAISEGRKSVTAHADPADGDYKMLVAELVKGGWTQAELELFADPKGASRTTPERYCQMMQDFFAAHLTIPDAAVQDRLLHRTLKLVVAG